MNRSAVAVVGLFFSGMASAGGSPSGPILPHFDLNNFHAPLRIDNWLSPMPVGRHAIFHELEDGECKVNDVVVTDATKQDFVGDYAGLSARPVTDQVWADPQCNGERGLLLEDTTDWYGQDDRGNVWYFGEDTTEYTYDGNGNPTGSSKEGSWEAGRMNAKAGIVMLAKPIPGAFYRQEFQLGVAEDNARVDRVDVVVATGLGRFRGCTVTRETTPLSPGDVEFKSYCPNLGLVLVKSPTVNGGAVAVDLGLH